MKRLLLCLLLASLVPCGSAISSEVELSDPQEIFNEAVRLDLSGGEGAASAFSLYRRAAEKGLVPAEFNVAVMLDSGRGVTRDSTQAAVWYARAAAHGDHRAAYDLGQLYEFGDGVPRNIALARAWFESSTLAAGRQRGAVLPSARSHNKPFSPPTCLQPMQNGGLAPNPAGIELVWTAAEQPEAVHFFVEMQNAAGEETYSAYTEVSSALVPLQTDGIYRWRVSAVAALRGQYFPCSWSEFQVSSAQH